MKRTIIISAIIGISISAVATAMAQNRGRTPVRQSVHVNGQSGNDQLSRNLNRSSRGVDRDTNHDGRRSINWGAGIPTNHRKTGPRASSITDGTSNTLMGASKESITIGGTRTRSVSGIHGGSLADGSYTRRANGVTFEGNDEPLWVRGQRNSSGPANAIGTAQNVGPQINGNVRTKGFANTTFDDEARTSQLVQGNQIGTDRRPRRTGLFADSNGDSDVDANDYALKGSSPKTIPAGRRSGITGGDFDTDGPTTVGRSATNGAARSQSLSAGTYGRGNRR